MNLSELLNFRSANKYILSEDYTDNKYLKLYSSTIDLRSGKVTLPKGLIFTIVSVRLNNVSQTMICKIIRSKKIIEAVYKPNNIDPKFYTALNWSGEPDEYRFVRFTLYNEELIGFLNTIKATQFTSEYKRIIDEGSESYL